MIPLTPRVQIPHHTPGGDRLTAGPQAGNWHNRVGNPLYCLTMAVRLCLPPLGTPSIRNRPRLGIGSGGVPSWEGLLTVRMLGRLTQRRWFESTPSRFRQWCRGQSAGKEHVIRPGKARDRGCIVQPRRLGGAGSSPACRSEIKPQEINHAFSSQVSAPS